MFLILLIKHGYHHRFRNYFHCMLKKRYYLINSENSYANMCCFFTVLELESPIINWSEEITSHLGSRIYPLWNRSAGDCLLDSILQASYGVFDKDNTLRKALFDSLSEGASRYVIYILLLFKHHQWERYLIL